ncbi:MAG TPA: hypothetical protein VN577_14100 [Terriglobales bacterium]|nr:hypothetical protein [Terriglobales bacterium]
MNSRNSQTFVIVDIDGTIADVRHRLHHIQGPGRKDWNAFFEGMDRDSPKPEVIARVHELALDHRILIVTGRPELYRKRTERWLQKNNVPFERLFMRRSGDHSPDYESKRAVLNEVPAEQIVLALDDRPPVCEMWEKHGIKCQRIESDEGNQEVNQLYQQKPEGSRKPPKRKA